MSKPPPPYISYLLRLWPAEDPGAPAWRASLENPRTGERKGFPSLEALCAFLEARIVEREQESDDDEHEQTLKISQTLRNGD